MPYHCGINLYFPRYKDIEHLVMFSLGCREAPSLSTHLYINHVVLTVRLFALLKCELLVCSEYRSWECLLAYVFIPEKVL